MSGRFALSRWIGPCVLAGREGDIVIRHAERDEYNTEVQYGKSDNTILDCGGACKRQFPPITCETASGWGGSFAADLDGQLAGVVVQFAGRMVDFQEERAGFGGGEGRAEPDHRRMHSAERLSGGGMIGPDGRQQNAQRQAVIVADGDAAGLAPPDFRLLAT